MTQIIQDISAAADALLKGQLVAMPTETVYGLGADATNAGAVARVFAAKDRPSFNPLISHVHDVAAARQIAEFDPLAMRLAHAFWPGPMTLVLPRSRHCRVAELATAGLQTIAVRVPRHDMARALLKQVGRPIAAPSANPSGQLSPTQAAHVAEHLRGKIEVILDAGPASVGLESTIISVAAGRLTLLRPGGLPAEVIEEAAGQPLARVTTVDPDQPTAPGQLLKHYAPKSRLRLNVTEPFEEETLLTFGPVPEGISHSRCLTLSTAGDLMEAAANLFSCLHRADAHGLGALAVMPIPEEGLGLAINDRLRRAATK